MEIRDFLLKTDHKPIVKKFQHNSPAASPRQARFIDYILRFTSQVEHVSGRKNVAGAFSSPLEPPPHHPTFFFIGLLAISCRTANRCRTDALAGEFFVALEKEDERLPTREFVKLLAQRVASFRYHPSIKTNRSSHLNSALFNPLITHFFVKDHVRRYSLQPAHRGPYLILERCSKFFVLNYGTHQDRVSIDRLWTSIFSMTSLNEEYEDVRARIANLEESIHSLSCRSEIFDDLDDTCSRTPPERHAEQPTPHDNSTRNKHTSKWRPIHAPKRFTDYEILYR